jgi:hypothetical protein
MATVQEQVLKLTKLEPKSGETAEAFTARVVKKVNALADADATNWEALDDEAQTWVNDNGLAQENDCPMNLLTLPETEGEEAAEEAPKPKKKAVKIVQTAEPEPSAEQESSFEAGLSAGMEPIGEGDFQEEGEEPEKETAVEKSVSKKKVSAKKPAVKKAAAPKKEKVAKPVKAAKPVKEKKAKNGAEKRGRKPSWGGPEAVIKVLVKENPHREGTKNFKSFSKYKSGMTVGAAISAGVASSNIWYESKLGNIKVG